MKQSLVIIGSDQTEVENGQKTSPEIHSDRKVEWVHSQRSKKNRI